MTTSPFRCSQRIVSADILVAGAGLAGTSLVLALLNKNYQGDIVLCDKSITPNVNKTWCFWGESGLPAYLRPLIKKRWSTWKLSDDNNQITHTAQRDDDRYCCIDAEDYFSYAEDVLNKNKNVQRISVDLDSSSLSSTDTGIEINSNTTKYVGVLGFNSICDVARENNTGLYQSFCGAKVKLEYDAFDPDIAGLMLDLQCTENALQFLYMLPFSANEALFEVTRFSVHKQQLSKLKELTKEVIEVELSDNNFSFQGWEQGVLPMFAQSPLPQSELNSAWRRCGIAGDMIRASTGYAFLPIQRWSAATALDIVKSKPLASHHPIPKIYQWMDALFLDVLTQDIHCGPELFVRMAQQCSAKTFSQFMTERASWKELLFIVKAMPKKPFLGALARSIN